ncbi:hypothetical protein HMPREF1868_01894 [Olsenella sp. DNF00959]|nr:hypothetical protein HMPREF1868_01894 [Olsenella sp. DNF00959]
MADDHGGLEVGGRAAVPCSKWAGESSRHVRSGWFSRGREGRNHSLRR